MRIWVNHQLYSQSGQSFALKTFQNLCRSASKIKEKQRRCIKASLFAFNIIVWQSLSRSELLKMVKCFASLLLFVYSLLDKKKSRWICFKCADSIIFAGGCIHEKTKKNNSIIIPIKINCASSYLDQRVCQCSICVLRGNIYVYTQPLCTSRIRLKVNFKGSFQRFPSAWLVAISSLKSPVCPTIYP